MKYLVIATLLALVFSFLYRRLRPYIDLFRKVFKVTTGLRDAGSVNIRRTAAERNKLSRCVACGTWVPAERAISLGSGSSLYCSRECLEKVPAVKNRKVAG